MGTPPPPPPAYATLGTRCSPPPPFLPCLIQSDTHPSVRRDASETRTSRRAPIWWGPGTTTDRGGNATTGGGGNTATVRADRGRLPASRGAHPTDLFKGAAMNLVTATRGRGYTATCSVKLQVHQTWKVEELFEGRPRQMERPRSF